MIILVTEDTGLGFNFISMVLSSVFGKNIKVVSSAYGNPKGKVG